MTLKSALTADDVADDPNSPLVKNNNNKKKIITASQSRPLHLERGQFLSIGSRAERDSKGENQTNDTEVLGN